MFDETREHLENDFKENLNKRYPDLDAKYFALALDSFQKGMEKAETAIWNLHHPECQMMLFNSDFDKYFNMCR